MSRCTSKPLPRPGLARLTPCFPPSPAGLFIATAETAQPTALLAALRGALDDAVAAPPPADELRRAKQVRIASEGLRGAGHLYPLPLQQTLQSIVPESVESCALCYASLCCTCLGRLACNLTCPV